MSSSELPEYAVRNRARWAKANAEYTHEHGVRSWRAEEITWGLWGVPESELKALPDVAGKDVIELGCGTAYFSAWFAQRGARPVGVDITPAQLETARRLQEETGLEFPLLEANAEEVPLPDASFDLAFSKYPSEFDVLDIKEMYAPEDAEKAEYYFSDLEWAKRWPWEEIWRVRKR